MFRCFDCHSSALESPRDHFFPLQESDPVEGLIHSLAEFLNYESCILFSSDSAPDGARGILGFDINFKSREMQSGILKFLLRTPTQNTTVVSGKPEANDGN